MMGNRIKLSGGAESDVLYGRQVYCYLKRAGVKSGIKKQMRRRSRRQSRQVKTAEE